MQTDATSDNIVACCWGVLANNVASVCMGLKVWPVSKYTQQVPTLLWFHANGQNMLGPTILRVVGQQWCVLLANNVASVCMGLTTVFDFMRPLGVFHQNKIVFRLPSIIDTIYGNVWGEPALRVTVFSYRWRVIYLFSEGFYRVQDITTILHVGCTFLKKLIKLYRETSTVNYPAERAAA